MKDRKITKLTPIPKLITINNEPMRKKRVAAYARVSTDNLEQQTSFAAQVDYYTKLIAKHPEWEFVKVYADEGISGCRANKRSGFMEMIADCEKGLIDLILTKSVSRFARNTVDSITTIRNLKSKGIGVYFEKENILTLDSKGEFLITLMSSLAQEESRSISENVRWGQRKRFADGKSSLAYSRFLGYDQGTKKYEMVINKEQAVTVRKIFRLCLQGYADSIKSVEAMIESNEDKVRAICEYLRLKVYYDECNSKITTYDKELYSLDHYYDLQKYKKAAERVSELKLPDGSLPNVDTLDAHIKAEEERMKLFSEKHKSIMTELRNLHLVKENIERINNGGDYEINKLADNAEFDHSAAVHNINTQIKMMNLMNEYGFKTYEELETKIRRLKRTISAKTSSIKHYSESIERDKKTVEAIRNYRRLQPVYNEYIGKRSAPEKELFGVEHHLELAEYKKAYETMAAAKLPDGSFPTEEYTIRWINNMVEKIADCTEKRKELEKELRNLSLLKENIDSINGNDLEEDEEEIEETRSRDRYSR